MTNDTIDVNYCEPKPTISFTATSMPQEEDNSDILMSRERMAEVWKILDEP